MPLKLRALTAASLSTLLLASCGGSSSPTPTPLPPVVITPPPPLPPVSNDPVWTQGVFEDESEFVAQCETPRTGIDPATNQPFVDQEGSELLEKFWQRSFNNRTYLFYDEVTDVDPAAIDPLTSAEYTRLGYFDILKTTATTPSGKDKDEFHFTQDTAERFERVSTGASASYGAQYAFLASAPPRDVRIAFTEADSPFAAANVVRGAKILSINGIDAINGANVDGLNAGLFPSEAGVETVFEFEDTPGAEPRTVTVTSAIVTSDPVFATEVIEQGDDKIGYVAFNTFGTVVAQDRLYETFNTLADEGIDDLVLDLRYNGGGFIAIASQLGYMIAGAQTAGQTFEVPRFNDKFPNTDPITGEPIQPTPFYNTTLNFGSSTNLTPGLPLPTLDLDRVFILSTAGTCSASELVLNSLQGIDVEVILVGDTTCGKPFGFYTTDNCGVSYSTVQFQTVNAKGFGDYADGFTPNDGSTEAFGVLVDGCVIPDDFSAQLGDTDEALLNGALTYASTDACPVAPAAQAKSAPNLAQRGVADAAGPSMFDSAIYQREMAYRQELMRDFMPAAPTADNR